MTGRQLGSFPTLLLQRVHAVCVHSLTTPYGLVTYRVPQYHTECRRMKIYTKTGDTGISSLYNGDRLPKDADFFCALGDVDELNSTLGAAREFCTPTSSGTAAQLEVIQSRLLDVGSAVATPASGSSEAKLQRTRFGPESTLQLEVGGWNTQCFVVVM